MTCSEFVQICLQFTNYHLVNAVQSRFRVVDDSSEGARHVSTDVSLIAESLSVSICKSSHETHYSDNVTVTLFES